MSGTSTDGDEQRWARLAAAAEERRPVRARVHSVDPTGASVRAAGVEGRIAIEDFPFLPGLDADALEGRRVAALVVAHRREEGLLALSPRALALERIRERTRRLCVRLVARGPHGVLAEAGGLRAFFAPDDPPRRHLGRLAGWVGATTPHLAFLTGERPRPRPSGALTEVLHGTVTAVDDAAARVELDGHGHAGRSAVVPRAEIAWHPVPSAAAELRPGDRVGGRVIDLALDGPVLSIREAVPSPWPAIALELAPGTPIRLRVRVVGARSAIARVVDAPHATAIVERADVEPGQGLTAVVAGVDLDAGRLHLERVRTVR